jgi:predicted Holliday junction resolvase-like endonuclease
MLTKLSPHTQGAYYGTFGSPILKCFLGALFTYQLAYYLWYKLETVEERHDTRSEIAELQEELRQALEKQRHMAQQKWGQAAEAMQREKNELGEAVDAVVEEVREGADEVGKGTRVVGKVASGGWWPW